MAEKLVRKWWYRLLKVIYIVLFAIVTVTSTVISYNESRPSINFPRSTYSFKCTNGDAYGEFEFSSLDGKTNPYSYDYSLDSFDFKEPSFSRTARFICQYEDFLAGVSSEEYDEWVGRAFANEIDDITSERNYSIVFAEQSVDGSWWYVFLALAIPILLFLVIRYVFFYVSLGEHKYFLNEINSEGKSVVSGHFILRKKEL